MSSQDPNAVGPGSSTYSLRSPDTVSAAAIPSMPMERVLPRQTSTGLARGIQQLGSPNVYVDSGNEQIVVAKTDSSNSSTPRVLMGNQVNKGEGFYVTKPGVDVTSASNDSDFIFNSNQNVFKIVMTGVSSTPAVVYASPGAGLFASSSATTTVPHNLGYFPAIIAYATYDGASYVLMPNSFNSGSGGVAIWNTLTASVDAVNIYFQASVTSYGSGSNLTTIPVKYYLLQETANVSS